MKIEYSAMIRDFFKHSSIYDDCRRPRRVAPRRISNKQFKKNLPAVPRRGPEAEFRRIITIFKFWVRTLCSCLFLQSKNFIIPTFVGLLHHMCRFRDDG
jgi:hypothetical protein